MNFQPSKSALDITIFSQNPLLEDKQVKKELERMERARIERKIKQIQKEKGVLNYKLIDTEELINSSRNIHKPMNFSIDKRCNKDTFSSYSRLFNTKTSVKEEGK